MSCHVFSPIFAEPAKDVVRSYFQLPPPTLKEISRRIRKSYLIDAVHPYTLASHHMNFQTPLPRLTFSFHRHEALTRHFCASSKTLRDSDTTVWNMFPEDPSVFYPPAWKQEATKIQARTLVNPMSWLFSRKH